MTTPSTPGHRQSQLVWLVLVMLGALPAIAGWYRWAT
jgi:hypothetical protein